MDVIHALRRLSEKFIFWLEVLSVLRAVGDAVRALDAAVKWLGEVCLDGPLAPFLATDSR